MGLQRGAGLHQISRCPREETELTVSGTCFQTSQRLSNPHRSRKMRPLEQEERANEGVGRGQAGDRLNHPSTSEGGRAGVDLANVKMLMNPFDEILVEEALRLREMG